MIMIYLFKLQFHSYIRDRP